MLLVPRSREFFRQISINALGFAGALLVKDEEQMDALRRSGPLTALTRTALKRRSYR
jgi:ATP adenylyltransferase